MADTNDVSWRSRWASLIIRQHIADIINKGEGVPSSGPQLPIGGTKTIDRDHIPHLPLFQQAPVQASTSSEELSVGIVGAGCAGLFTVMIFNHLKEQLAEQDIPFQVNCEIFEAAEEKRLGGRLYTYEFPQGGPHDYYDVGAMRFPDIPIMKRTYDLFAALDMKKVPQYIDKDNRAKNLVPEPPKGSLIPYWYSDEDHQPTNFNDIQYFGKAPEDKKQNPYDITGVPQDLLKIGPEALLTRDISVFVKKLKDNPKDGWDNLLKWDGFSARQFLSLPGVYIDPVTQKEVPRPSRDYDTIEWMETFNSGTRWFDQSFSEQVLEAAVFDPDAEWRCIMGGAAQVVRRMLDKIREDAPKTEVHFASPVTAIGLGSKPPTSGPQPGKPYVTAGGKTIQYDAVFNSAPLGCMRRMDLRGLSLTYGTKQALRALNYGASCKVGIRFSEMWWISRMHIQGGLGKTDLPIRVCVYPSYNLADPPGKDEGGGVLLCSYSWAQDADRMGATIKPTSPHDEDTLRELLFDNLALLHSTKDDYEAVRNLISGTYQTHHAFDWTRNELSTGAFAWFGPGQFRDMYPEIIQTDGRHIMIGEIASSHHAWIVGALESAVRGVYQFLGRQERLGHKGCKAALDLYREDKVPGPYGPMPVEFNRPSDVMDEDGKEVMKPVAGEFASYLSVVEISRLELEAKAAPAAE